MNAPYRPRGTELRVDARQLSHRVLRYGEPGSPDLLLLPGITSTALALDFVAHALSEEYRVYVPDIRGRGGTVAPDGGYTLDDYAADAVALAEALDFERPVLLGHSMGARIAAATARLLPHGPLVLVDPPLSGPHRPYPTSASSFAEQLTEARRGTDAEGVARWYPHWPQRELAIRAQELPTCDPTAVAETHGDFERERFEPYWAQLPAPVTLIRGAQSPVVTDADVPALRRLNPRAQILEVPSAGHMVPWDNLDGFLDAVRTTLDGEQATPGPPPAPESPDGGAEPTPPRPADTQQTAARPVPHPPGGPAGRSVPGRQS